MEIKDILVRHDVNALGIGANIEKFQERQLAVLEKVSDSVTQMVELTRGVKELIIQKAVVDSGGAKPIANGSNLILAKALGVVVFAVVALALGLKHGGELLDIIAKIAGP